MDSMTSAKFSSNDARPAIIVNSGIGIIVDGFTAQRGSGSPSDVAFQTCRPLASIQETLLKSPKPSLGMMGLSRRSNA